MPKKLPQDLTSYDLIKALAIVLMVIDHIGYHFYPDEMWFRVLGRLCVPIWFFLIGYARTREVPAILWAGGALLVVSGLISGQYLFPLNILFALALTRLWIDGIMARALRSYEAFAGVFFLLLLLSLPSVIVVEYATIGVLFAMFGFLRRHKAGLQMSFWVIPGFVAASSVAFILHQVLLMPILSEAQLLVFAGGMLCVSTILFYFSPREYPAFKKHVPVLLPLMHLLGRRTLEIYVIHVLLLRGLSMWLDPDRFGLLDFQIAPAGMISLFIVQ